METDAKTIIQETIGFACSHNIHEELKEHMKTVLTEFEWNYLFSED